MGNINAPVRLTIVASVDTTKVNIGHTVVSDIKNQATIGWDGKDGINSNEKKVGIGLNPISKKVGEGGYKASTHEIPWTVTVQACDVDEDLYVLDLLVYGTGGFSWSNVDSMVATSESPKIPGTLAELNLGDLKESSFAKPTPRYNQKYVEESFDGGTSNLYYVVYTLRNSAQDAIADLLLVTGNNGEGINYTGVADNEQSFSFKTLVTNPNFYAGNSSNTVYNNATLYSGNTRLNEATASTSCKSKMLFKDMLNRSDAEKPDENKNNGGAATENGYDYEDHTVVYRLHVNANNLNGDFTEDIAIVDGVETVVGSVYLTDTLPDGWEFVEIESGKDFLIYKGTPGSGGKVTAGEEIDDPSSFLTADFSTEGEVVFTFTELTKPYVILLKAQVTTDKVSEYFSGNVTNKPENKATLSGGNWSPGIYVTRDVTIKSQILDKTIVAGRGNDQGVLTWTVEYKPNEIERVGAVITDTLPVGLDLRVDQNGELIFDGNITVRELTLNSDSSYNDGDEITLPEELKEIASYDNDSRELTFTIPEPEKAYRFTYITDVTGGNPGETLTNTVELRSGTANQSGVDDSYKVAETDASATMQRSGWIEITKRDGKNNNPLPGVEFTIFSEDGNTVIRKGLTDSNGVVALRGIPVGTYTLKETATLEDYIPHGTEYVVEVKDDINGGFSTSINGSVGDNSNKITILNYKVETYGDLKITKKLEGANADYGKEFDFSIVATTLGFAGTYDYIGGGGKPNGQITFDGGVANITLKGGESILVKYLPKDIMFTVTEKDYRDEGYSTTSEGANATIVADGTVEAMFTNSKKGWIEITKTDAANGSLLRRAEFTLYDAVDGTTVVSTGVTDENGKLWFLDLDEGEYTLVETKAPDGYNIIDNNSIGVTVHSSESGLYAEIAGTDGDNKIDLVNYETGTVGDLQIMKSIAGNASDPEKEFNFTISLTDLTGVITGDYDYIGSGGKADGVITFDSGAANITLKGGESITIKHLPKDIQYEVIEDDYSSERYYTTKADDTGSIEPDKMATAAFVNSRSSSSSRPKSGSLMISKFVTGEGADADKEFCFTVTFSVKDVKYSYTGFGIPNGTIKSGDRICLTGDQSITINGLPDGTTYTVEENDYSDEGYTVDSRNETGKIRSEVISTVKFTNHRDKEEVEKPKDPEEPENGDPDDPDNPVVVDDPNGPLKPGEGTEDTPEGAGVGEDEAPGAPKTGDTSNVALWITIALVSLAGMALLARRKSQRPN